MSYYTFKFLPSTLEMYSLCASYFFISEIRFVSLLKLQLIYTFETLIAKYYISYNYLKLRKPQYAQLFLLDK